MVESEGQAPKEQGSPGKFLLGKGDKKEQPSHLTAPGKEMMALQCRVRCTWGRWVWLVGNRE